MQKETKIVRVPMDKLAAHPENPNRMSKANFKKLKRHIKQTGNYEPLIVREHPEIENHFQIINGHHRAEALRQIGENFADCVVWNVDDEEARILLATLNRLGGKDVLSLKSKLIQNLSEKLDIKELSKFLPDTKQVIERLRDIENLKFEISDLKTERKAFLNTLVFFLNDEQMKTVQSALDKAMTTNGSKAERMAKAITTITNEWMNK